MLTHTSQMFLGNIFLCAKIFTLANATGGKHLELLYLDEILSFGAPGTHCVLHLPTQHFVDTRPLAISYCQVFDNEKFVVIPF